jgi:hypothetical protein
VRARKARGASCQTHLKKKRTLGSFPPVMILWTPHCTCAHPDTGARCAGPSSSAAVSCEKLCWLSCCNRQNSAAIAARCYLAATGSDNTRSNRLVGHCWLSEAGMVGPTTPPEQSTPNAPPLCPWQSEQRPAMASHGQPRPATASWRGFIQAGGGCMQLPGSCCWPPVHAPSTTPHELKFHSSCRSCSWVSCVVGACSSLCCAAAS